MAECNTLLLLGSAYLYSNENSQENDLEQPPKKIY